MKCAGVLLLAAHALGVAIAPREADEIQRGRGHHHDWPITRTFDFPNPFPTHWADSEKRDAEPAAAPAPADAPDPDTVQIISFTYGGTGCPSSTVSSVLSDDREIITFIFDEYVATIGPNTPISDNRKNCQLNINLRYPGGFQFSIFEADYRGYAHLDPGVTATQESTYYFSGQVQQASTRTNFNGPQDGDFLITDQADSTSIVWSPCGENAAMNINSQIRLVSSDPNASGMITNDSLDASFRQIVHVKWQKCK